MNKTALIGLSGVLSLFIVPVCAQAAPPAPPAVLGQDAQQTHDTGIDDAAGWSQAALIAGGSTTDGSAVSFTLVGSTGTAVSQHNIVVVPVVKSAGTGTTGYLVAYDLSNWVDGQPKQLWADQVQGLSSGAPVIINGNVYASAGDTLFQFDLYTGQSTIPAKNGNLYADLPKTGSLQNQVGSNLLYATAQQQGTSADSIWVSSRNGWLFAIDPATLKQQAAIYIGTRLDGSPGLVTDTAGNSYIAVGTSADGISKAGVGTLAIIDPRSLSIFASIPNAHSTKYRQVVTAPVCIAKGQIMWNDVSGDVFLYELSPDGSYKQKGLWMDAVQYSGQTFKTDSAFSKETGLYLMGMTSANYLVTINPAGSASSPAMIHLNGSVSSAPVVSKNHVYIGNNNGSVDILANTPQAADPDPPAITTSSAQGSQNPVTVSLALLANANDPSQAVPTLLILASDGLHIWQQGSLPNAVSTQAGSMTTVSNDLFLSKYFNPNDLTDGKVLQQNPFVIVANSSGPAASNLVNILEYVGKGLTRTGAAVTYWKSEQVNKTTGNLVSVFGSGLVQYSTLQYPKLLPPADGQGIDFGQADPPNPVWATGFGLNSVPVPGWNPLVATPPASGFADVPDSDINAQYIRDLYQKNVVNGTGEGRFSPQDLLTREQFAKMVVGALHVPLTGLSGMPFTDLYDDWAKPYIASAYAAGIAKGTSDTTFNPTDPLTREQGALMVRRYLLANGVKPASDARSYDAAGADSWAQDAVQNVMAWGLRAEGKSRSSYFPQNGLTRGDAAALIDLAMQLLDSVQSSAAGN